MNEENEACTSTDSFFTINNLLGYLLYRENYVKNRSLSAIGEKLLNNISLDVGVKFGSRLGLSMKLELPRQQ